VAPGSRLHEKLGGYNRGISRHLPGTRAEEVGETQEGLALLKSGGGSVIAIDD
jgi:hypothetical protein